MFPHGIGQRSSVVAGIFGKRVTRYGLKSGEKKTCNDAAKRELSRRRFEELVVCVQPDAKRMH